MFLELFFQYLVAGLTYGTIYAIVGIGFNIIYNTTGIINFAQGEFVMLGGMNRRDPLCLPATAACHRRRRPHHHGRRRDDRDGLHPVAREGPSVLRMIIITIASPSSFARRRS